MNTDNITVNTQSSIRIELDKDKRTLTISGNGKMADYSETNRAPWYNYREYISDISDISNADNKSGISYKGDISNTGEKSNKNDINDKSDKSPVLSLDDW